LLTPELQTVHVRSTMVAFKLTTPNTKKRLIGINLQLTWPTIYCGAYTFSIKDIQGLYILIKECGCSYICNKRLAELIYVNKIIWALIHLQ
jgi:hypothetical protein